MTLDNVDVKATAEREASMDMDIEDVLSIPGIAIMLFVMIAMVMIGLSEYPQGRTGPNPANTCPDYCSTERAGVVHHTPSRRSPSHQKETLWK